MYQTCLVEYSSVPLAIVTLPIRLSRACSMQCRLVWSDLGELGLLTSTYKGRP